MRSSFETQPPALLRSLPMLLIGTAILAFGLYNVHAQSAITEGGVLGLSLLIRHHFGISPGITEVCIDGVCYLLGWKFLGKAFFRNAVTATVSFSLFYQLFERFGYLLPDMTDRPLLAAVCGAAFVGVGVGLVVRGGGASCGDDILALILNRYLSVRLSFAYLFTDITVLMLSLTYIPLTKILYSLLTVTLSSLLIDFVKSIGKPKCKAVGSRP